MAAHLPGGVGDDPVIVVEMDAKAPVWKDFLDLAIDDQEVFLGQFSGRLKVHGGLFAAPVAFDFIAQALIFLQRVQPSGLHGADVDETVISAIVGLDEAETTIGVEEFYGADGHEMFPFAKTDYPPAELRAEPYALERKGEP